jgi:lipoprotein
MKKLLALTASLLMAVSFVSCGNEKDGTGKQAKDKVDAGMMTDSGPDKAANDYIESLCNPTGGKTYLTIRYPDEYIEELKNDGDWEDEINFNNDFLKVTLERYKRTIKDIEKGNELTDEQLEYAELSFLDWGDYDINVSKGYEYEATVEIIDLEDDYKEIETKKFCVVELDEGWKVITLSAEELEYFYG